MATYLFYLLVRYFLDLTLPDTLSRSRVIVRDVDNLCAASRRHSFLQGSFSADTAPLSPRGPMARESQR